MEDKKGYDIIPADDIAIFYGGASPEVRRAVSQVLQQNDRFFMYTSNAERTDSWFIHVMDANVYGDFFYNVLYDFAQRYGHLLLFDVLMGFLQTNTHPGVAAALVTQLNELYAKPPARGDDDTEGAAWVD